MAYRAKPVVLGALLLTMPFAAQAQSPLDRISLGGSLTFTSEYLFRGIPQTSGDPALQGSFDASFDTGGFADVYAGVWASSVEFRPGGGDPASIEVDYYAGLNGTVPNTGISWDIGAIYYTYPDQTEEDLPGGGETEFNYWEGTVNLGYSFDSIGSGAFQVDPSVGVGYAFTPEFFGEDDTGHYFNGSMNLGLPYGFNAGFLLGYQEVDGGQLTGPQGFDYAHYSLSLSKDISKFTLSISWNDGFANDGANDPRSIEDQFVASISAGF